MVSLSISRKLPAGLVLAAAALAAAGCDGDGAATTTGKRLTLGTRITAEAESTRPFTNALGWSITLTTAHLSVGPLYYFEGSPFTARLDGPGPASPPLLDRLARWALPEAHAHPGHYQSGEAKGQMAEPTSVDLMKGPTELAQANAVSGFYRSARFVFGAPPAGPFAAALDGHVVAVEGRAEKAGATRVFRARVEVSETFDSAGEPAVEGCVFEEVDVEEAGVVTVVVKPGVWLDQVDFEGVAESADGAPVDLSKDSDARRGFARGLKKGTAYVLSFAAGTVEKN